MRIFRVDFDPRTEDTGEGVAHLPAGGVLRRPDGERVIDWVAPFVVIPAGGRWDFMPSNSGVRICSPGLVELLAARLCDADYVQWLPVETGTPARDEGWRVLHFSKPLCVLDRSRSTFLNGRTLLKPAFDGNLVGNLGFFSIPGCYTFVFYVDERLKAEVESRGLQGLFFKQVDEVMIEGDGGGGKAGQR